MDSKEMDSEAQIELPQSPRADSILSLRHPRSVASRSDRQNPDAVVVDTRPKYAPNHGDTSAPYWELYELEAKTHDKNFVERLIGNTNSMVILNTLFSAIVAAFIIEIYRTLSPTNSQPTVIIAESTAFRINIVLFLSFFLSIVSAVACALIQQWCYEYLRLAYPRATPHERGRVRTYLFEGLNVFPMRRFTHATHVLLHTSVILFFWAVGEFLYTVDRTFGLVIRYTLVLSAAIYTLLSISPLIFSNTPYNTPMTPLIRAAFIILRIIFRIPWWCPRWLRREEFDLTGLEYYKGINFDSAHFISIEAEKRAEKLEPRAMKWLFTENDFSDSDMDTFLASLPGYIKSHHTKKELLDEYLTNDFVLTRIKEHLITCATSVELSEEASNARVFACIQGLRLIFQYSRKCKEKKKEIMPDKLQKTLQSQRMFDHGFMDGFRDLCEVEDPMIALRASCIRAFSVQNLMYQLAHPDTRVSERPQFPPSLVPFYQFCFPNDNKDAIQQLMGGHRALSDKEITRLRNNFLNDGPLANLIELAKAVRNKQHAPPSNLSFCWKTFDILLAQFGAIRSDASSDEPTVTSAQRDFDNLYSDTHKQVIDEKMGYRMTPLLEVLHIVDRRRRLLTIFSSRPKYHTRVSVVFGKDYLRNADILEAFVHCLPDFIAINSPDVCMDLMEKVVYRDDLWSNLQVILWTTQKSISSTPDKLRVFERCCNVLDVAFSVLEDSREVDWRAPEFGSLWQQFESFITHGIHGAFLGRSASFRISIIKVRFCKALLTQFWDDVIYKKMLSFQTQWDVASLAKLIYYLRLRDEDDPEYWNSYLSGGHIGAEFTDKALKMVKIIARDGPLSIFCQLGYLATSTISSRQSGVERKDMIGKVLELQIKLMVDQRMPLNGASDAVWKELDRLREQVEDLCAGISGGPGDTGNAGNAGEEGSLLRRLLRKIDYVRNLRVARSEGPSRSVYVEERPSAVPQWAEVNGGSFNMAVTAEPESTEGELGFEQSDCPALSSSRSAVQGTLRVRTIDATPMFRPRGPSFSLPPVQESTAAGQSPRSVTSAQREDGLIVLLNPIISLPPR